MELARIAGTELEYRMAGDGEPVVMIHGAFIADAFLPLAREPALAGEYRVLTYRRRGYGASTHPAGPLSIARQAADCAELLHHLGIPHAHVVGHSYGGAIALQLAADAPDVVGTLALLEPALFVGRSASAYRESLRQGERRYREAGAEVALEEMLRARWGEDPRPAIEALLPGSFEEAVADASTPFEIEVPALCSWRFGEAEASMIRQSALVILGERSRDLSPRFVETFRWLLTWLPAAEGHVLPGAAHGLQMQNPEGAASELVSFLQRHPLQPTL